MTVFDLFNENHKTYKEMSNEIFSFHIAKLRLTQMPRFLLSPSRVRGLKHAESFFVMNLGENIGAGARYNFKVGAFFAWWESESALDEFLKQPSRKLFSDGWHIRMKLYRRWGEVSEIKEAIVDPSLASPDHTTVAVTLARLKLSETQRFIRWGKPVEQQVRDHKGQVLAIAAMRPLNTFCTFSIWKNEAEMINMVRGRNNSDGESHMLAMQERTRKDFHHEFTTMRFVPFKEYGTRPVAAFSE